MPADLQALLAAGWLPNTLPALLVLARVAGLVAVAPVWGAEAIPFRFRVLLALALTLAVAPVACQTPADWPSTWSNLIWLAAQELTLGLALGTGVRVMLAGAEMAGQLVGQWSGLAMAELFTLDGEEASPFSQLFHLTAVALYLTIGGHRLLVAGLLDSFTALPPGAVRWHDQTALVLVELLGQSLSLAVCGAAPVAAALIATSLVLGLVARSLPQLNPFSIGLSLSAALGCVVGGIALSGVAWALVDGFPTAWQGLLSDVAVAR